MKVIVYKLSEVSRKEMVPRVPGGRGFWLLKPEIKSLNIPTDSAHNQERRVGELVGRDGTSEFGMRGEDPRGQSSTL